MDQKCIAKEYFINRVLYWKNINDNNNHTEISSSSITDLMQSCKCDNCIKNLSSNNSNSLFITSYLAINDLKN
jgi:hypothetical protein